MPIKALVAFGVVCSFALLALPSVACAFAAPAMEQGDEQLAERTSHVSYNNNVASPLTLEQAILRTLQHNPFLAVFAQEIKARNFEARQAGLFPNPELSIEVENVAGSGRFSGTDSAETTVRLSQLVELGGKRRQRQAMRSLQQKLAEREYDMAQAEAVAETKARFVAVLAAQMRFSLAEEKIAHAQKMVVVMDGRFSAGKSTAIESVRFQALVAEARLHHQKTYQELLASRRALTGALGSEETDFDIVQGNFAAIQALPDWSELVSRLENSPEIIFRKSAGKGADQLLALEQAKRLPDLTLSFGGKNDQYSGDNALVAELSIPLPIFNRNQGAIEAARTRLIKARNKERTALLQTRVSLSEMFRKLQGAHTEVVMLRKEILPAAQKIFDTATYGFQAGKFGLLVVLDAEQILFEVKERHIDSLEIYHQAMAEVQQLIGEQPDALKNTPLFNFKETL